MLSKTSDALTQQQAGSRGGSNREAKMSKRLEYKLQFLPLSGLRIIWQESQRPLNKKWAAEIAENFDPELFEPPIVTKPNCKNESHIIDGQHRVAAARQALGEDQEIPCHVYEFDDPAKAADMFSRINEKRKKPHQIEMFRTKVTAGYADEATVNRIVNSQGYAVGYGSQSEISCPAALLHVYRRYNGDVLTQTLSTLSAIYGTAGAMVANHIKGFGAFLSEYRTANLARLVKMVRKRYPDHTQLAAAIKQHKDLTNIPGSDKAAMAVLVAAYNRSQGPKLRQPA